MIKLNRILILASAIVGLIVLVRQSAVKPTASAQELPSLPPLSFHNELILDRNSHTTQVIADDQYIWAGSEDGIIRWEVKSKKMALFDGEKGLKGEKITALTFGPDGTIYIGTENGLFAFVNNRFESLLGQSEIPIKSIAFKQDGLPMVLTDSWVLHFVEREDFVGWEYLPHYVKNVDVDCGFYFRNAGQIFISSNGHYFMLSGGGLCQYLNGGWQLLFLDGGTIHPRDVSIAPSGDIWMVASFSTNYQSDNGILILTTNGDWQTYSSNNYFGLDWYSEIAIDQNGIAWLASEGGGFASFDGTTINTNHFQDGFNGDAVKDIYVDESNTVWVASRFLVGGQIGNWTTYLNGAVQLQEIAVDNQGHLWLGEEGLNGLAQFDGSSWILHTDEALSNGTAEDIKVTSDGSVWVNLTKDDVPKYSEESKTARFIPAGTYRYFQGEWEETEYFIDVETDRDNNIWIANYDGMHKISQDQTRTTFSGTDIGLKSNINWPSKITSTGTDMWLLVGNYYYTPPAEVAQYDGSSWQIHTPFPVETIEWFDPVDPETPIYSETDDHLIIDIGKSHDGTFWALTQNRIGKYIDETWEIIRIPTPSNITNVDNFSIYHFFFMIDKSGLVWIPTSITNKVTYQERNLFLIYDETNQTWIEREIEDLDFFQYAIMSPDNQHGYISVMMQGQVRSNYPSLIKIGSFRPTSIAYLPFSSTGK